MHIHTGRHIAQTRTVLMYLYVRMRSTDSLRSGALEASRNFFAGTSDDEAVAGISDVAVAAGAVGLAGQFRAEHAGAHKPAATGSEGRSARALGSDMAGYALSA
jgi:hypothetical protein